ncbi:uncharacterized protein LOC117938836 [Etheostoma cragini]|uniref:uncharacterized protein LOC117938836 n=1 Tax=Etheostoma cragini TaxID=417921 RepID=UPI00155E1B0C|nr:uncharacterized protein LOC117938836 [Etheostoma cragini]
MACLMAAWSVHNPTVTNSIIMNTNGPPDLMLDPRSVCVCVENAGAQWPGGGQQPAGAPQTPLLQGHVKKADPPLTEAQRFSSLPRRPAVNIEFRDVSYSVREGPWWRRKGTQPGTRPLSYCLWSHRGIICVTGSSASPGCPRLPVLGLTGLYSVSLSLVSLGRPMRHWVLGLTILGLAVLCLTRSWSHRFLVLLCSVSLSLVSPGPRS